MQTTAAFHVFWPRLVQLSWIVTDENGNKLKSGDHIVRPSGFTIPKKASDIHGITTQMAMEKGDDLTSVIAEFMDDFNASELIVGHNIEFDKNVLGAELRRMGMRDIVRSKKSVCTMKSSKDYYAVPGKKGYRYPSLRKLHIKLFGKPFDGAHDSASDTEATERCFCKLKELGVIQLP